MNNEDASGIRLTVVGESELMPTKLQVVSPGEVTAAGRRLWIEPKNNYVKATRGSLATRNLRQEVYPFDDTDIEDRGAARAWASRMLSDGWKMSEWKTVFGYSAVGFGPVRAGKVAT